MDRSYTYNRRLASRAGLRRRLAAALVTGLVATAALLMWTWNPEPISASLPSPAAPLLAVNAAGAGEALRSGVRRIYPYSVVPGGVSGQAELKRVIRTDSVVAAHYATFDADKAHTVVVDKPRAVHVSYRKGDKVYWTAHKVMLAPGETLLSDGRSEMRARCANRISDLPQYPVEPHRPAMEELDQPVEFADGEHYAIGPGGVPVAMGGDGGIDRRNGLRFHSLDGSGDTGASADGTPPGAEGAGSLTTPGLSGSSSSMGNRPLPSSRPLAGVPATTPAAPVRADVAVDPGPGSSSSSGSPTPSSGGTAPGELPTSFTPATTAPPPGSPAAGPQPKALPIGTDPAPSSPGPKPDPEPKPDPVPPQTVEQPAPTEVPEPGSLWLFGLALAVMGVLRRRRRA